MSDRQIRYGMIVLDVAPAIERVRDQPMIFRSAAETVEYAKMHAIERWMVYGDPEGWWPLYTQDGPVNPAPEPKARVDISLHRSARGRPTRAAQAPSWLRGGSMRAPS